MTPEEKEHISFAEWIQWKYPELRFNVDCSGMRITMGLRMKLKRMRSHHKKLDFFLEEPRGDYSGLYIEIKKDRKSLFMKNGSLRPRVKTLTDGTKVDDHKEQWLEILDCRRRGYAAFFACGKQQCIETLEKYLSLKRGEKMGDGYCI